MTDVTCPLPVPVLLALEDYYVGRENAKTARWSKKDCLDALDKALPSGWGFVSAAGSFWFSHPDLGGKLIYVCDKNFPEGVLVDTAGQTS